MDRLLHLIIFFFVFFVSFFLETPHALTLPVNKQDFGYLYYTSIEVGSKPSLSVNFVLDVTSDTQFPWFDCSATRFRSSSYRAFRFGSSNCNKLVKKAVPWDCPKATGQPRTSFCFNQSCGVFPISSAGRAYMGSLGHDVMLIRSTTVPSIDLPKVVFSCVDHGAATSVPKSSPGRLALSKNSLSLPIQISSAFSLPLSFALCLPSSPKSHGTLFIGGGPYLFSSFDGDVTSLFATTPLITNPLSHDYYIDVLSIQVDGEAISFNKSLLSVNKRGNGGTKLDISGPYTFMRHSIFKPFLRAFKAKAMKRKMVETTTYTPYSACFARKSVKTGVTGPDVPVVDLVLKGGKNWRIYGSNSMVDDGSGSYCLTIKGGERMRPAIHIGSLVMEDNLLEFDLGSSTFSVTSSLLPHKTSCADSFTV